MAERLLMVRPSSMPASFDRIVECLRALPAPSTGAAVALHGRFESFAVSVMLVPHTASRAAPQLAGWKGQLQTLGFFVVGEPIVFASVGPITMAGATRVELPWGHALLCIEAPRVEEEFYPEQTLAVVRKTTEAAVLSLTRQLKALTDASKEQCQSLERVVNHFVTSQGRAQPESLVSSLSTLEDGASRAYRLLESRLLTHANEVTGAAQQASTVVSLAKTIDSVAQAVRLVTVNAQIESARLGAAGKGFGIIAQQMRELSSQVHEANQSVTSVALELAETLPALTTSAGELAKDAGTDFQDLGQRLSRLRENFDAAQKSVLTSLEDSQRGAREVQSRCEIVAQELQFEDRINQLLQHAEKQVHRLESLLGVSEAVAPDLFERAGRVGRNREGESLAARMGSVQLF